MRSLGRKGGRAKRAGVAERLPDQARQSLRDVLRDTLDHEKVKAAIEQSLAGGNESARVAAVKFLADLELYRADGDDDWRKRMASELETVRARLDAKLRARDQVLREQKQDDLADQLAQAAAELWAEHVEELNADPDSIMRYPDIDAKAVLRGLVDRSLIRPPAGDERVR